MAPATLPVLTYHSIGPRRVVEMAPYEVEQSAFADQMAYLADAGYTPIPAATLGAWLRDPNCVPLPPKPVVITFDDGYANFALALEVLERHAFPAALYVPTAYVGSTSTWLRSPDGAAMQLMSWGDLADVARRGVEVASHGHVHRPVDERPAAEVRADVVRSKELLEDAIGREVSSFAYPHGHNDARGRRAVAEAGYEYAFACRETLAGLHDDRFAISRVFAPTTFDASELGELLVRGRRPPRHGERLLTKAYRAVRRVRAKLDRTR